MPLRSTAAENLRHGSIRFELSNEEKRSAVKCGEKKYLTNNVKIVLFFTVFLLFFADFQFFG